MTTATTNVIETVRAALQARREAEDYLDTTPVQHTMPLAWHQASLTLAKFNESAPEWVADLVGQLNAAQSVLTRIQNLAEEHPGNAWNSGINLRDELQAALNELPNLGWTIPLNDQLDS